MSDTEQIVRALVALGREYEDNSDQAGIWDDGFACAFCGQARWDDDYQYADERLTTALHDPDCVWRLAVEWVDSHPR